MELSIIAVWFPSQRWKFGLLCDIYTPPLILKTVLNHYLHWFGPEQIKPFLPAQNEMLQPWYISETALREKSHEGQSCDCFRRSTLLLFLTSEHNVAGRITAAPAAYSQLHTPRPLLCFPTKEEKANSVCRSRLTAVCHLGGWKVKVSKERQ